MARRALVSVALAALGSVACERPRIADPRSIMQEYVQAAERGDAVALHALLTRRAQREFGIEGTRRIVAETRRELASQSRALRGEDAALRAAAVIRYEDGEEALLELERGVFKLTSAGTLPAAAQTPAQALGDLRRALARRSYAALLRVLSSETQSALERDLGAIVEGLEDPQTLEVEVRGETAEVELPDGHLIRLRREAGVWRVEDVK